MPSRPNCGCPSSPTLRFVVFNIRHGHRNQRESLRKWACHASEVKVDLPNKTMSLLSVRLRTHRGNRGAGRIRTRHKWKSSDLSQAREVSEIGRRAAAKERPIRCQRGTKSSSIRDQQPPRCLWTRRGGSTGARTRVRASGR
jgi:hypothetical protein